MNKCENFKNERGLSWFSHNIISCFAFVFFKNSMEGSTTNPNWGITALMDIHSDTSCDLCYILCNCKRKVKVILFELKYPV